MRKYLQLARLTFLNYFVYRLNFVLWRFRSLVFYSSLIFFWLAIYSNQISILGYEKTKMLTYIIGVAFLRSFVLASISSDLAGYIRDGQLNRLLLQPMGIFKFWLVRDIPDKVMNLFFTLIELSIVIKLLNLKIFLPSVVSGTLFLIAIFLALFLAFFVSLVLSLFSFWTEEIWAIRWLFGVIFLEFFSGQLFPIDIMPSWFSKLADFTPFPYLIYYPAKIWLEQISGAMAWRAVLICVGWLLVFYWLAKFLWQKGVKNYGAYGG